jgi:hypothetical protein
VATGSSTAFTFTPTAVGTYTVRFIVTDDDNEVGTGGRLLEVRPPNAVPTFQGGADQTVAADSGAHAVPGWATELSAGPSYEAWQTLTFIVTNDNPALFSEQPRIEIVAQGDIVGNLIDDDGDGVIDEPGDPFRRTGTLIYTLAAGAFGAANMTVILQDDGGMLGGGQDSSDPYIFTITSMVFNEPPTANAGGPYAVDEGDMITRHRRRRARFVRAPHVHNHRYANR